MTPGAHSVFLPAGLQRLPLRPTTIACFEGHWELHPRHTPHSQLNVSISVECTSSSTTIPLKANGRWPPPLLPTVCRANGPTCCPIGHRPTVRPASDRDVKLPRQVDVICFHPPALPLPGSGCQQFCYDRATTYRFKLSSPARRLGLKWGARSTGCRKHGAAQLH